MTNNILIGLLALGTVALFSLAFFFDTFVGDLKILEVLRWEDEGWRILFSRFDITLMLGPLPAVVMAIVFLTRRMWPESIASFLILPAQGIAIILPKILIARPRPPGLMEDKLGSFPSGTAATSILALGLLIYLIGIYVSHRLLRLLLQMLIGLTMLALGLFRMFAGEHWPSDVIAGYMVGGVFLIGILWIYRRLRLATKG